VHQVFLLIFGMMPFSSSKTVPPPKPC
jgi:hypothetical protein